MAMDLFAIECFLKVAETGSFTKAADQLLRTQSAISQQINKLETFFDKQLIIRSKPFQLTTEGKIFMEYAQKIYILQHDAIDSLKSPELKGEIIFGLPEDFANIYLSDILTDFAHIHPKITLKVECDLTLNLLEKFKNNNFDLVMLKMHHPDDYPDAVDILKEELVWVGNKNILNNINLPLVLSPLPCVYHSSAINALRKENIDFNIVFSSHSFASKIAAVKAGLGITVLPRNLIPKDLKIIYSQKLPQLEDSEVCLLKKKSNSVIDLFEKFILDKLT